MPKRARNEDTPPRQPNKQISGLLTVRLTAGASLDLFLDLRSIANLRASCLGLSDQYDPQAVPALWTSREIKDPGAVLDNPNMTVRGAALLQKIYKFTAAEARKACCGIFTRASETGDFELAKWYTGMYSIAGLLKEINNYEIAFDPIILTTTACRQGHLPFIEWLFETLAIELNCHDWSSLISIAVASRSVRMADWFRSRCPPHARTKRVFRRGQLNFIGYCRQELPLIISANDDVEMMMWAKSAFAYTREGLNEIAMKCLLFGDEFKVAQYLLRDCGPIGRGPHALKIRELYEGNPRMSTNLCPLPEEPEDSVYDPASDVDPDLLPEVSPEELARLDELDAFIHQISVALAGPAPEIA